MRGCSGLFYTFEPPRDQPTYDEYMVEMEIRATHNVLEACAQTETIEKVVFTSSVTAVIWEENRKAMADLDERNWSDPNFCRNFKLWHALAKTLSEKTAWALAMDRDVNMVSINAGLLKGPELTIANPYLKGSVEMFEDGVFVTVDAEFFADAQICIFEDPSAYGRYLCFDNVINRQEDAIKLSKMLAPSTPCPPPNSEDTVIRQRINNKKINKLMKGLDGELELSD
jgi:nucleoside-diphosphate-sugar epimerase